MCMCMQGYGSAEDVAGGSAYLAIQDELEDYANAHPEIRPIIDPLYLVRGNAQVCLIQHRGPSSGWGGLVWPSSRPALPLSGKRQEAHSN